MQERKQVNLADLPGLLSGRWLAEPEEDAPLSCGYSCDLLSWVMAHARPGMAWVTVQTHMNVIAVAALMDLSCVILPEDLAMEEAVLKKAREEGIAVLTSALSAYALCARLSEAGLPA